MDLKKLIEQMTLEEKAGLCSGADFWHTKTVERLGVPAMMVSDGPHGLRKQEIAEDNVGMDESIEAVCFPAGCATAASFDRELLTRMGEALGNECRAEHVGVILGPAVNIKRSPLCGRNFEYFSEDPYLASQIATAHIKGVQSKNVGTSIKHFLANSQETRRMSYTAEIDDRTLREIYLASFETAIKEAKPWTVMCSYNRINGTYAAQNKRFLTDVLRTEWGYEGFVVSDWGAVNDRVRDLQAGLDLEMPSSAGLNDKKIVEAVQKGELDEEVLDTAVERILKIVYRSLEEQEPVIWDKEADHALARRMASECMVLLKNEGVLPLKKDAKVAFIGKFADVPRFQGGGSSHINSYKVDSAWALADRTCVTYAQGYVTDVDEIREDLVAEAKKIAGEAEVAVIFAGLPDAFESEGYDRTHMKMPACQNALIEEIAKVNKNVVVVLHNGSPVEMPWIDSVSAVLETYLGGQAVGGATLDVLYGDVNPSGHLAETFPLKLEDNPSYLYYFGEGDRVEYREGIFVGYRYYDKKKMQVLFPFGHGLSYTTFAYKNLKLDRDEMADTDTLTVSVDVENTGKCFGKEVVQLYVAAPEGGEVIRPVKELKEFAKVGLMPGETKTVTFQISKRAFAYFDTDIQDFRVPTGEYKIMIGRSVADIRAEAPVTVRDTSEKRLNVTLDTVFGDIRKIPGGNEKIEELISSIKEDHIEDDQTLGEGSTELLRAMMEYLPIHALASFIGGKMSAEEIEALPEMFNRMQD